MLDCRYRDGPPPSQRREILQTTFLGGSGGNGRAVLHSDLLDARVRRSLLDAGTLRDEASPEREILKLTLLAPRILLLTPLLVPSACEEQIANSN